MNWGDKKVVIVGDSRVAELEHVIEGWRPKNPVRHTKSGMNTEALLKIDQMLDENIITDQDPICLIVLMGLHCDFTKLEVWRDTGCTIMVPNRQLDISMLVKNIKDKLIEWKGNHLYCQIIITVPYIPNFGQYNSSRLFRKLDPDQVLRKYPNHINKLFTKQMKGIIDKFFQSWNKELTPRPIALARMEYFGNPRRKQFGARVARPFQGSTRDGLHFARSTVGHFCKLIKLHHEYLNKHPGKSYQVPNKNNPSRASLENKMSQLSVQPRVQPREPRKYIQGKPQRWGNLQSLPFQRQSYNQILDREEIRE